MRRLGKEDVAAAIDDQLTILRKARHVGSKGTIDKLLVRMVVEEVGQAAIAQTILTGDCSADDRNRLADETASLPPLPDFDRTCIEVERLIALDLATEMGRYWVGSSGSRMNRQMPTWEKIWHDSIDRSPVFRAQKVVYDEVQRKISTESLEERFCNAGTLKNT